MNFAKFLIFYISSSIIFSWKVLEHVVSVAFVSFYSPWVCQSHCDGLNVFLHIFITTPGKKRQLIGSFSMHRSHADYVLRLILYKVSNDAYFPSIQWNLYHMQQYIPVLSKFNLRLSKNQFRFTGTLTETSSE